MIKIINRLMRSKSSFLPTEIIKINSVFYLALGRSEEERRSWKKGKMLKDVAHTIKQQNIIYPGIKRVNRKMISSHLYHFRDEFFVLNSNFNFLLFRKFDIESVASRHRSSKRMSQMYVRSVGIEIAKLSVIKTLSHFTLSPLRPSSDDDSFLHSYELN